MKDNQKTKFYNQEFDSLLRQTETLSKEILDQFYDAYSYDAATTYNWLVKKLMIIKDRLEQGDLIQVDDDLMILSKDNFLEFIKSRYPNTMDDLV